MAKKFFNETVNKKRQNIINACIISACIVGILLCFCITESFNKKTNSNEEIIITLQESVQYDINSGEIDNSIFFLSLEGVEYNEIIVDYSNVNFDQIGEYYITIYIIDEEYDISFNIVDVSKPILLLTSLSINIGDSYSYSDFIASCIDNSNEDCIIGFSLSNLDQYGENIDYSSFKEEGVYNVVITASDSNGNITYEETTLTIGDPDFENTVECSYGNDNYNTAYILSYSVSNNGCALSLDLYQSTTVREPIDTIADNEAEKIKTELNQIANLTNNMIINRSITAIMNNSGTGFIGYSLYTEVTDGSGNVIVSYYLNINGSRIYIENPYNLA